MKNRSEFYRFAALLKPHLAKFAFGMLALGIGSAINLFLPQIVRKLVDTQDIFSFSQDLYYITVLFAFLFTSQAIAFYLRSYLFLVTGQQVAADLRMRLFRVLVFRQVSFFDQSRVADLISRLTNDVLQIQNAVSLNLSVVIRYAIQVLVGVVLMVAISWRLTAAIILLLPGILFLAFVLGKQLKRASKELQAALGHSGFVAEQSFNLIRIVKAFVREDFEIARYARSVNEVLSLSCDRAKISAFFSSFVSLLLNLAFVAVIAYGCFLVSEQRMSAGDLSAFVLYGIIVAVSFAFLINGYSELLQALGAADRIFELSEDPILKIDSLGSVGVPLRGELEFKNITFSYPTRVGEVIRNISFRLEQGKSYALVGPSGCGKSTIVQLIFGFYAPNSGQILLDGKDIAELPRGYRSAIGIVPQEPQLFAVSIEENLRYGKEDATLQELEQACAQANILDFIKELPEGFKTYVGERGVQLSAGQKQRVAIARAILRDPRIIILDEATSALDSQSEGLVQDALEKLLLGRTSLTIAHRLSTVQNVDQILVMKNGEIVERGDHIELLGYNGLYREFVEGQRI